MKAQASFEFLSSVIVVAVVLLAVFSAFYSKFFEAGISTDEQSLTTLCYSLAEKINAVDYYGTGFEFSASLPQKIGTKIYTITAQNLSLQCTMQRFSSLQTITAKNLTNGTAYPPFEIFSGSRSIKNSGTGVVVS
ncbi:MAG TPA: hypothetical protein VI933_03300 [archaeon]|nr:hypothetical protein [archaeon]